MKKTTLKNVIDIAGQPAIISYVDELGLFRGKFLNLSGYCDFLSDSIPGLKKEGETSLREYLEDCRANGIDPYAKEEKVKTFTLRYPESFGEQLSTAAAENNVSLNTFIIETLNEKISRHIR